MYNTILVMFSRCVLKNHSCIVSAKSSTSCTGYDHFLSQASSIIVGDIIIEQLTEEMAQKMIHNQHKKPLYINVPLFV